MSWRGWKVVAAPLRAARVKAHCFPGEAPELSQLHHHRLPLHGHLDARIPGAHSGGNGCNTWRLRPFPAAGQMPDRGAAAAVRTAVPNPTAARPLIFSAARGRTPSLPYATLRMAAREMPCAPSSPTTPMSPFSANRSSLSSRQTPSPSRPSRPRPPPSTSRPRTMASTTSMISRRIPSGCRQR